MSRFQFIPAAGRSVRGPFLALVTLSCLAASCPMTRGSSDGVPTDARRVHVPLEGSVPVFEGALRVTFVSMERGGTFADVTLTLETSDGSITDEVTAVRQRTYSDPVRLPPWSVVIVGFPGVDSVDLAVWRTRE